MASFRTAFLQVDYHLRRFFLWMVRGYQTYLGWLLGGRCRFVPSCSCYAEEALQRGPLVPALLLIVWRLLRCQPLCKGGMDPVPNWMTHEGRWIIRDRERHGEGPSGET